MTFANNPAHAARNAPHAAHYRPHRSVSTMEMSRHVRRLYPSLATSPGDLAEIIAAVTVALGRDITFDGAAQARLARPLRPEW